MSPKNETSNANFQEVLVRWKKAYDQLASVLDSFSLECTQLSAELQHPGALERAGLQESLLYVETAFASLVNTCSSQMSSVCAAFTTALYRSRPLPFFDKLPDELAVHILSLVNADDTLDLRYEPYPVKCKKPVSPLLNIMTTNKRLRQLATNTPSLWTYVDVFIGDLGPRYAYSRDALLNSQQLPLQVRITGKIKEEEETEYCINSLTYLLNPHAHRIASLDFRIPLTCAWPVILNLFSGVPSCRVREFYINDLDAYPQQFDDEFPDRFFTGELNAFFQSLQVIGMRGFFIPFTTPAYHDLTVLKIMPFLFELSQPSTLVEIRNALAACPKLRSLAIIECYFEIDSEVSIEPALLLDLEVLELRSGGSGDECLALMSCIDSGPSELALSVSIDSDMFENPIATLRRFIRQSNVTRLCLDATVDVADMDWLLALPHGETLAIRELALCSYDFEGVEFDRPLRASRFPCLHTLYLMGCEDVDARLCHRLLDASTIQVLRFDKSRILAQEIFTVAPSVEHCRFSTNVACGEDDCEWPVYLFKDPWHLS